MSPTILAIRAVAGEIAHRIYLPVLIIAIGIMVALVVLVVWLVTMSLWWLLLAIPVVVIILVSTILLIIARVVLMFVMPAQNKTQRKDVKKFTDKLLNVSEVTQTPKFIILFRVAKDAIFPNTSSTSYIESVVTDTISLHAEFKSLRSSFGK